MKKQYSKAFLLVLCCCIMIPAIRADILITIDNKVYEGKMAAKEI